MDSPSKYAFRGLVMVPDSKSELESLLVRIFRLTFVVKGMAGNGVGVKAAVEMAVAVGDLNDTVAVGIGFESAA